MRQQVPDRDGKHGQWQPAWPQRARGREDQQLDSDDVGRQLVGERQHEVEQQDGQHERGATPGGHERIRRRFGARPARLRGRVTMPRSRRGGEIGPRLAVLRPAAVVLAGNNLDAVRAELQFHIVKAPRDRCLHRAGLPHAGAVDRDGVRGGART